MSLNLLSTNDPTNALDILITGLAVEAGICLDSEPLDDEPLSRHIKIKFAEYDVINGLILTDQNDCKFRLRVVPERLSSSYFTTTNKTTSSTQTVIAKEVLRLMSITDLNRDDDTRNLIRSLCHQVLK